MQSEVLYRRQRENKKVLHIFIALVSMHTRKGLSFFPSLQLSGKPFLAYRMGEISCKESQRGGKREKRKTVDREKLRPLSREFKFHPRYECSLSLSLYLSLSFSLHSVCETDGAFCERE